MLPAKSGARVSAPLSGLSSFLTTHAPLLVLFFLGCGQPNASIENHEWKQIELSGQTMGTTYHVKIVVPKESEIPDQATLKRKIDQDLEAFGKLLSTWDPESELSKFNEHVSTDPFPISPETIEIVETSMELYRESEGAFDPTVGPLIELWGFGRGDPRTAPPSEAEIAEASAKVGMDRLTVGEGTLTKSRPDLQLNLSAIAKGYGVDVIAQVLLREGYSDLMVEIGGEVVVRGANLKRNPWTIGVDSPVQVPGKRELIEVLSLDDCAVATSGDYRNSFEYDGVVYSHILDPKTGWPIPESVKSVTVIAPTCMLADGAATAIMAMGAEKGLGWAQRREDLEALIFVKDAEKGFSRLQTSGMETYLLKDQSQ